MSPENMHDVHGAEANGLIKANKNETKPQPFINMDIENPVQQKERANWAHGLEFLLSCVSLSVGLGNLWRFPYTCYKNGGAAFLIPYFIVLFLVGKPFYFLEMVLGQFNSKGSMKAVQVIPLMKGIGWGQQFVCAIISTYYTSLIGLSLSYCISSFASQLPWSTCLNYSTPCYSANELSIPVNATDIKSSTELFFENMLNQKDDISDGIGAPSLRLAMCLLISWVFIYVSIVKGIKTSGKLSYVFAIVPYIILITILIFAIRLDGAIDGISLLFTPKFEELKNIAVWYEACTQCFYSLTVGMGSIMMFSSYNKFNHNIYRDAAIISLTDTFTSVLGGSAIFAVLGNLAFNSGKKVEEVTKNSMGLAFISYPEAIAKIGASLNDAWIIPQIMAVIFFGMLFILGVGSTVGLLNNVTTNFKDAFPNLKYWLIAGLGCLCGFFTGLVYVTEGGIAILGLIDHFEGSFLLFTFATLELIGIVWIYGFQEICWDVEFMLERKLSPYWRICWGVIMPIFLISTNVYMILEFKNPLYGSDKPYPMLELSIGYALLIFGLSQIIFASLYIYNKNFKKEDFMSYCKYLVKVNPSWGPAKEKTRKKWIEFKEEKRRLRNLDIQRCNLSWPEQKLWEMFGKFK